MTPVGSRVRPALELGSDGQVFLAQEPVFVGSTAQLLDQFQELLQEPRAHLVVTSNVDQMMMARAGGVGRDALANASIRVLDGMPLVLQARMMGASGVNRLTGADLMPICAAASVSRGWRVVIVGGAEGVAAQAVENLKHRLPQSNLFSVEMPFLEGPDDDRSLSAIHEIRRCEPDVVFVCMGFPRQEAWVMHWTDMLPPAIYVGAGAAVDFAAGRIRRAPRVLQKLGLEWLFRLASEPRRLAIRYITRDSRYIPELVRAVSKSRLRGRR